MKTDRKHRLPVLLDHKSHQRVGHTESISKTQTELSAEGVVSATGEAAREVLETSDNGFEFEASVGAKTLRYIELKKGNSREVNGRIVTGPALIADRTVLREISFVGIGADSDTQAIVAEHHTTKELTMEFEAWLEASGIDNFDELTENVQDVLKASFEASKEKSNGDGSNVNVADIVAQVTAKLDDNQKRQLEVVELRLACGDDMELYAEALEANYSLEQVRDKIEIKKLKGDLKATKEEGDEINATFNIHVAAAKADAGPKAVEAALCLSAGMSEDDLLNPMGDCKDPRKYGDMSHLEMSEKDVELGRKHFQGIGLQRVMLERANVAGYQSMAVTNDAIRAALSDDIKAASPFSMINLPTLFQNVVDRELMKGYELHPTVWQEIAVTRSVRDFRQTDRIQFGGLNSWTKVSEQGKLDYGHMDTERTFVNQADTYGQINVIDRRAFINDDLGVLTQLGQQMAFWGSMVPEDLFSHYLNDGKYTNASDYYVTSGAAKNDLTSTSFGLSGLDAVYDLVKNRKSPIDGKNRKNSQKGNSKSPFMKLDMKTLLLPSELVREATNLLSMPKLEHEDDSSSSGKLVSENNFHYGKYKIVESPYISDTAWGGDNALATTWFMFADKRVAPAVEFVFLNGVQRPTVEAAKQMEGDRLGVSIRGWYDLGINFVDQYASVRCKA